MEQELDLARKMQVSLFPDEMPKIAGYSLAAFWQPAHEISGDYYNVFNCRADAGGSSLQMSAEKALRPRCAWPWHIA